MDLSVWLRDLGLERYAAAFAANDVDADILPQLTAEDLIALGITSVGHRRKLLEAIAGLQASDRADAAAAESAAVAAPTRDAERRQLTVLFCDLVGSTELSARLDPEDMRAVITRYHNAVAGEITRFEGHVAKFMGDGVLAYFGWPSAHEDDAERAVRAGLALVPAVGGIEAAGRPLAARIGIATGLVVVGDLIGEGAAREQAVVGETPNLAARLQALAEPGTVVISQATRRLIGGLFELADLGPTRLKGFAEPLAAFRVEGEGRAEGRFEALHGERLTPLVGREHELAMLTDRWSWAKDGDGQVVLVMGEAGIGKSRLLRALRQRLSGEPHVVLSHFCSPYHTNSALHPIIAQLERAAGFVPDDAPKAKLAKLEALLGQATDRLDEAVPLLGALLSVPTQGRYPPLNLSPERQKQRTLEVLIEQLAGLARDRPVLESYEDLHWVDPSTLEMLDILVERVRGLPVLVVLTYRPEFSPPWSGQAHVTALTMNRLGRRQGAALVKRMTGGKALPPEVLDQILARTDGVPLFVEELTRTVLESGLLTDTGDHYELSGPLPQMAIPTTLHDSLMARLDRLAPVKELAQTAAVIGREFSHELLAAVSPLSESDLNAALDRLVAAGLIFRRGAAPLATYTFKHALVQDAAYQSLLKSRRQQLHAQIAATLAERFPGIAKTGPELLAHHFAEAGLLEDAVFYSIKAARESAARSAMAEAVAQSRNGLDLLARLPDNARYSREELELQSILAAALVATVGNAAVATGQAYARARALCEQLGDTTTLVPVLSGLSTHHQTRSEFAALRHTAVDLLRLGQQLNDTASELVGNRSMALCLYHLGEFGRAREHFERVLEIYIPEAHHPLTSIAAFDMRAVALSYLALELLILGYPEQARQWDSQALSWSRNLRHPHTQAFSLHYSAVFHLLGRAEPAAEDLIDELRSLAAEHRFPVWLAGADVMRGHLLTARAEVPAGLARARQGLAARTATGLSYHQTYFGGLLAAACLQAAEAEEAASLLAAALATVTRTGERWFEAELHRLSGECHLAHAGDRAAAETCFCRAIAIAREQGAKLWELRAATSLARLCAEHGRRAKARELLAPVYGWFTEGFASADLKDAKALLEELR
jgi:predicted ATPase/class 3 adenylate cyclase